MRTLRSLLAAVLAVVMIVTLSVSAFAAYENIVYDDVSEMYGTTLSGVNSLYIKFVDKLGIIPGMKDGSFNPFRTVTRGEALKIAYRMLHYDYDELEAYGSTNTKFDEAEGGDINDVHTLKPYIAWAQDYQLINAEYVPDNKFDPNANISGEEFITLIAKVLCIADGTTTVEDYETTLEIVLMDSELDASKESVNREQAAVIVARAMLYDAEYGDISEEMFIYFSSYNVNCLATKVYGCYNTELTIRATKQRPMDYEGVVSDVLFSNGGQYDVGADLSEYVGWPMEIVFLDKDGSGTLTQDEEIITYQPVSPWEDKDISLSSLIIESFASIKGTSADSSTFKLLTNSQLYLNDHPWPADDIYKLTDLVDYIEFAPNTSTKPATTILNRPNLSFTFLRYSSSDNAGMVFAKEWIPGKIMTITDNYISVYSYYDNKTHVFEDNYVKMTNLVNPKSGDYVNFYIVGDTMHLTAGTTMEFAECSNTTVSGEEVLTGVSAGGSTVNYKKHLFYNTGSKTPAQLNGPVVVVLDETKQTYLAVEEAKATKEIAVEITAANLNAQDTAYADIKAVPLAGGEELELKVKVDNISTITGVIDAGDVYTYYETEGGDIIMDAIDPVTMNVIETEDYFIAKGGEKYLKTQDYVGGDEFCNGTVTLLIDRYDGVWGFKTA